MPRRIARPTPEPIARAALLPAEWIIPSWCPPRGPVKSEQDVAQGAGRLRVARRGASPGEASAPAWSRARFQFLERRFAIHGLLVVAVDSTPLVPDVVAFSVRHRTNSRRRRQHPRALGHARTAALIEQRDERLADRQLGDGALDIELRVRPQRARPPSSPLSDRLA